VTSYGALADTGSAGYYRPITATFDACEASLEVGQTDCRDPCPSSNVADGHDDCVDGALGGETRGA